MGTGHSPRPSGSTHSASGQQDSHSPKLPPYVPPGQGAGGRFRGPLPLPPSAGSPGCGAVGPARFSRYLGTLPSLLAPPRSSPGLGAALIGWSCRLLAKRPLVIGHGSLARKVVSDCRLAVKPILERAGGNGRAPGGLGSPAAGPRPESPAQTHFGLAAASRSTQLTLGAGVFALAPGPKLQDRKQQPPGKGGRRCWKLR